MLTAPDPAGETQRLKGQWIKVEFWGLLPTGRAITQPGADFPELNSLGRALGFTHVSGLSAAPASIASVASEPGAP